MKSERGTPLDGCFPAVARMPGAEHQRKRAVIYFVTRKELRFSQVVIPTAYNALTSGEE